MALNKKLTRVSINLPSSLIEEVKKIAEDKNLPITQTYILLLNNAIQNDKMIKARPDLLSSLVDLKEINQKLDTISLSQIDAKR